MGVEGHGTSMLEAWSDVEAASVGNDDETPR